MVELIDTGIPEDTNKRILKLIIDTGSFHFLKDFHKEDHLKNYDNDTGMSMCTYKSDQEKRFADPYISFNCYGFFICDIIKSKLAQKFSNLDRILWNVYWKSSKNEFHIDSSSHLFWTFVYNLNSNDGGTELIINEEKKFYPSKASQALVFPSSIKHRGVHPKTQDRRFCCAFMVSL